MSFDTPILFLVFNRTDTTPKVFEKIRQVKPAKLFIAADGPREGKEGEKEKCEEVRRLVLDGVDWPCDVKTLFRDQNLGCGLAVSGAISWFFENVEEGIILEDDCLPDPSFFNFCKTLLDKYRHEEKIKIISGNNFQMGNWRGDGSYFFSILPHIWGWATWKRTWAQYRYSLSYLDDQSVDQLLDRHFRRKKEKKYFKKIFFSVKNNEVDTWDYSLSFSVWHSNGLNVLPNQNLVSNIGFGENATNTKNIESILAQIPVYTMLDLKHPESITLNEQADQFYFDNFIDLRRPLLVRVKRKLRQLIMRAKRILFKTH